MPYVVSGQQIGADSVKEVGGKCAHLAELIKAGFPVPEAFFITVEAWHAFIDHNNLKGKIEEVLKRTDSMDNDSLMKASEEIHRIFLTGEMPQAVRNMILVNYRNLTLTKEATVAKALGFSKTKQEATEQTFVAVRSSGVTEDAATASSAGQYETFLTVRGEENLLLAVINDWASFFTPRGIYYRAKQNQQHFAGMGVVVQRMVQSEKSGVTFTVDPANPTHEGANHIVTEAVWGLGETIVQGLTDPDKYVVDKKSGDIINVKIGKKTSMRARNPHTGITAQVDVPEEFVDMQVLNKEEILTISAYAKKIEQCYQGRPQDIEWAVEGDKMYIVQTRAVTVLKQTEAVEQETSEPLLKGYGASPGKATGPCRLVLTPNEINKVKQGDILVTEMTSPDYVPAMEKSAAIITDKGGVTSHASIVGRELGKPVIVGTLTATKVLKEGQMVTVDAVHGFVYPASAKDEEEQEKKAEEADEEEKREEENRPEPTEENEEAEEETEKLEEEETGEAAEEAKEPTEETAENEENTDESHFTEKEHHPIEKPEHVKIKCNIAFPETAEKAAHKADGVGLLRLEHMVAKAPAHPAELVHSGRAEVLTDIIVEGVSKVAMAFHPKPVWVRTIDIRTDEFRHMPGGEKEPTESNPMIGWHGIRRDVDDKELFKAQIEAFKRLHEAGYTNVGIMLPFIISVSELRKAKELAKEYGLPESMKFGIMVETPAACWSIEEFCDEGIDFISFGSNDLAQLTLGIDRNNEKLIPLYEEVGGEMHPAMRAEFEHVIKICNEYGVKTSICGEAPSNRQDIVEFLVGCGISSLSVNMDAIEKVREWVAALSS
ncbi:MAG: phosphoenolpyruvate synthase [Candidatus Aenigmatarchaeota archaeon]